MKAVEAKREKRDGQDGGLTEEQKQQLAKAAAADLLKEGDGVTMGWVRMGRIIAGYAAKFRDGGKKWSRPDPYLRLAQMPEIPWSTSQLRNYEACAEAYDTLGGDSAPKVSITHYTLVLAQAIDWDAKRSYLARAAEEGLSVRDLKTLIDSERPSEAGAGGEIPLEWKDARKAISQLHEKLVALSALSASKPPPKNLRGELEAIRTIIDEMLNRG